MSMSAMCGTKGDKAIWYSMLFQNPNIFGIRSNVTIRDNTGWVGGFSFMFSEINQRYDADDGIMMWNVNVQE